MQRILILLLIAALTVVALPVFAEEETKEEAQVEEIILVFKTHFDIGYTKLASEVLENYRTGMIDNALDVVDASRWLPDDRKFVWTIPGWPLAKIVENQRAVRGNRLDRAIREGRFAVHALPFTTHTETLVEEDLVRGLRFASNINRQYDRPPSTDAKMTDVPSHVWFLPTLLAHSGVTFMHEGTNAGSSDPDVPLLYFREGPDGSRVLTMHVDGYGSGIDPPKDWPYKTWLGLIHTGDNHGPPRPEEVEALFKECTEKYPNAKVRIGRLSDFGNAILEKEDHDTIPVVRGDMPDTWIHGAMCDPQGQAIARHVHERLSYLEIANTVAAIKQKEKFSQEVTQKIAEAREQSLLYGEHTWGGSLSWLYKYAEGEHLPFGDAWRNLWRSQNDWSSEQKRLVQSWEEKSGYIRKANEIATELEKSFGEEPRFQFNPLPWELRNYSGTIFPPGGIEKRTLPYFHYNGLYETGKDYSDQSQWYQITIDGKTGQVKSLVDRVRKRELLASKPERAQGFVYHRASAAVCEQFMNDYAQNTEWDWVRSEIGKQGIPKDTKEQWIVPTEIESLVTRSHHEGATMTITYKKTPELPFDKLMLHITLYRFRPEIKFQLEGKGKKADTWPEAGYFHFPLNIENPQFRLGRLGGIMDPASDIVPGSNRHMLWLRTGLAVFGEDGWGVGICPLETPLVSLGEPGGWRYSKDYVPDKANVYFNLFNNQWTTNFRLWNHGDISASFVLWTFNGYDNESSLITPSLETLALHNMVPIPDHSIPLESRGVTLSRKGIYVTSFGLDPDSGKLMLRFWEMAGQGEDNPTVTVSLPEGLAVKTATPCDLRGQPIDEPIPVTDGSFPIEVKPYSPVNLQLEYEPPAPQPGGGGGGGRGRRG